MVRTPEAGGVQHDQLDAATDFQRTAWAANFFGEPGNNYYVINVVEDGQDELRECGRSFGMCGNVAQTRPTSEEITYLSGEKELTQSTFHNARKDLATYSSKAQGRSRYGRT